MNTITERIPAYGHGEWADLVVYPDHRPRLEALLSFCTYGPDYRRGVMTALVTYSLFASRSERASAEHFLAEAEQVARIVVGAEDYAHKAGTCRYDWIKPTYAAPVWCGDPRCAR